MQVPEGLLDRLKAAIIRTELPIVHAYQSEYRNGRWETDNAA
jgi:hypothetical protein